MTAKFGSLAHDVMAHKFLNKNRGETSWEDIAERVSHAVVNPGRDHRAVRDLIYRREFIPGGRYLYAAGRPFHQVNNCLLMRVEDSREGWSDLLHNSSMALMTGAGIGVDYSRIRERGAFIRRTGGTATGPLALMHMLNECGRGIMQGGSRRSAIWAGLRWDHPDILDFIHIKDWSHDVRRLKEEDFNFPAAMDGTNISVQLNDEFFLAYHVPEHPKHSLALAVYWETVRQAMRTGEPGFSVDVGANANETLRNACTEVTSADDSDVCNLGSINMARIDSLGQMEEVVAEGVRFLIDGSVYSDVPYEKVRAVRDKNRRIGIGLMGIHEWLLKRGKPYGPDEELAKYLEVYRDVSDRVAFEYATDLGINVPVKRRAVAPTGTIGIVAECGGTGIEPIFCAAFKRRYLKGDVWHYQFVVDPCAQRLYEEGVDPDSIEDAYSLARDPARRLAFQSFVQGYVDHGISSTLNLDPWNTEFNNKDLVRSFGDILMRELPKLRGVTFYPDGARGGQPLTAVPFREALSHKGRIYQEQGSVCSIRGGSCGD